METKSSQLPDRFVDTLARRSYGIRKGALECVQQKYKTDPMDALCHASHVTDLLSDRLSLAEHSLRKHWRFPRYKNMAQRLNIWF